MKTATFAKGLFLALAAGALPMQKSTADVTPAEFRNPPAEARPWTWWHWQHGLITKEGITADLEAMQRIGLGGAMAFYIGYGPRGDIPYMSDRFLEMMAHANREAARLGLSLGMHNCEGWSSSCGPWNTGEKAMQKTVFTDLTLEGPKHVEGALPKPPTRSGFFHDIAVIAFPQPQDGARTIENIDHKNGIDGNPASYPTADTNAARCIPRQDVRDISAALRADGTLAWDVPAGTWTIRRIGHTPTDLGHNECDKFSQAALDNHWGNVMAKVLAHLPASGRALSLSLIDSYEKGGQNWTDGIFAEFKKRRGYDPAPFLPALTGTTIDSPAISERFLWDWRKTCNELFSENYYIHFSELCRKNGLLFGVEPYGNGNFEESDVARVADVVLAEIWQRSGALPSGGVERLAGMAHTVGCRIIGAETFTADLNNSRWTNDPYSLKPTADRGFCGGLNHIVFHSYAHQPFVGPQPGMTMGPWGIQFNRNNTWWDQAKPFITYLHRCAFMLRQGLPVRDFCVFGGERASTAPKSLPHTAADICQEQALLKDMTVRDGRLTLPNGMSYRYLALTVDPVLSPAVLRRIQELAEAGATILAPSARPDRAPTLTDYPACDKVVREFVAALWGADGKGGARGKGRFIVTDDPDRFLRAENLQPDFSANFQQVMAEHRREDKTDIYFVANTTKQTADATCTFRVAGKVPELWDAITGDTRPIPQYHEHDGLTEITLRLDPAGSVFVVFRPAEGVVPPHVERAVFSGGETKTLPKSEEEPYLDLISAIWRTTDGSVTKNVLGVVGWHRSNAPRSSFRFEVTGGHFGADVAPGKKKELVVRYSYQGVTNEIAAAEGTYLRIAAPALAKGKAVDPTRVLSSPGDLFATTDGITLAPWQKGFWTLVRNGREQQITVTDAPATLTLNAPWTVRFGGVRGAPESVVFDSLVSWTERPEENLKYFSGSAIYETTFEVSAADLKARNIWRLDLGRVKNLAEVTLNGKSLGILWKPPFTVNVSQALKAGKNTLDIKVTNLWPNRLIGDARIQTDDEWAKAGTGFSYREAPEWVRQGKPDPSGRQTFAMFKHWEADDDLLESGLLGPVTLQGTRTLAVP